VKDDPTDEGMISRPNGFLMELPFSEVLRPPRRSFVRPGMGSQISRHIRRNRVLNDEIGDELAKSR